MSTLGAGRVRRFRLWLRGDEQATFARLRSLSYRFEDLQAFRRARTDGVLVPFEMGPRTNFFPMASASSKNIVSKPFRPPEPSS